MDKKDIINLETKGYTILRNWVGSAWINKFKEILPELFWEHSELRKENNNGIISSGVAMNVLVSDDLFIEFLQEMLDRGLIKDLEENYFNRSCILNSFTALNNVPSESKLFHKKVHRDVSGYSGSIPILLNMLVMVHDFTIENGGTLILPKSHLKEEEPTEEFWNKNNISLIGKAGDLVIWNSNVYHASGINKTQNDRIAIPITLSLPYYKQLLDYPRAIGLERQSEFNSKMQELLGYHSMMASSVKEWYEPTNAIRYR
jgi:ectoine hydroxylase-related dioxygenase (phytanoyl-CoA dioxygenase family)